MDGCLIPQCVHYPGHSRMEAVQLAPMPTLWSLYHLVLPVQLDAARPRLLGTASLGTRLESAGCCRMRVVLGAVEGQEAIDRQGVQ